MYPPIFDFLELSRYHLVISFEFRIDLSAVISVSKHSALELISNKFSPLLEVQLLSVARRVDNSEHELRLILLFLGAYGPLLKGGRLLAYNICSVVLDIAS